MNVVEQLVTSRATSQHGLQMATPRMPVPYWARRLMKNTAVALAAVSLSAATWAACSGVALDVGYDFDLGAKTGIAAADTGTCVAGATSAPAGDDYCAANTTGNPTGDYVIRTNDSGVATIKYTFNAGTRQDDYVVVIDIPQTTGSGARPAGLDIATWTGLPSACSGPTSTIINGGRRLICDLGTIDRSASGQITVAVPAPFKVSPRALNGETFKINATQQSTGGTAGACVVSPADTIAPTLTVSARPKIDIKTSAYTYSPGTRGGAPGYFVSYFVYVDGLNNATVGGEAVASPLNFNVGLSANIPTPGVEFVAIYDYYGNTTDLSTTVPAGAPAGNGVLIPVKLVANPGAPNCAAEFLVPGGACQEVPIYVPARLSTHYIQYFVPITAFGAASQIDFNNFINSDGSAAGAGINTPPASGVGLFSEPIASNDAPYTIVKTLPGSYAKYTAEFAESNTVRPPGSPSGNGVVIMNAPGVSTWCEGGNCKQYPTKNVESLIQLVNQGPVSWTGTIICDKFDNRGQVLTPKAKAAGAPAGNFPTNMPGDVIVATRSAYPSAPDAMPSGYTVEVGIATSVEPGYGTTAAGYPSKTLNCDDADSSVGWVDAGTVAAGAFGPYNMVRAKIPVVKGPFDEPSNGGVVPLVFFFTVPTTAPNGLYIGNALKIKVNEESFGGGATPLGSWSAGTFDPMTNAGVYTGERFQVVKALVRTGKEAFDRFGNTTTVIGAGKTVTYRITPSYTAAPGVPSPNSNIEVVDVLPIPLTYVVGTARSGTPSVSFEPNTITIDGSGRQVLTWVLPNVVLNSAIPPIFFDATAPATLQSGIVLTNKVTVAAPLVDQSTDAERSAEKAVTVDNVAGLFVNKSVSTPLIPRNGTYSFTVEVGNLKSTPENNLDIIDVLPRSGSVITSPNSNFVGTNVLSGPITPPAGGTVFYTNAGVGSAPIGLHSTAVASSNALPVAADYAIAATAANGWCTAAEITSSTAGCPSSIAASTAFRIQVPSIAGNAVLQVIVPMVTSGNVENNIYVNRFSAKSDSLPALFSNDVSTTVKQGKLSGKVYVDSNLNSQPTAGEPSIAGVTVTLTGIDSNGNLVTKTTTTDGSGNYQFTDLFPGTYNVTETQPTAYGSAGANVAGSAGGTVPNPDSFTGIPMVVGQNATNYNFGEIGSTIAGKVCEDLNNDGKCQAGEPPIAGTLITLTGTDSAGNAITRTATTSVTGDWKIADLPNPNGTGYTLTETQPVDYLDGKQAPGVLTPVAGIDPGANIGTTTPTVIGNDAITGIKFTVGTNGTNFDFAEVKPASLQGFVYYDTNKDGTRTAAEPGIVGVVLELTGTNDMGQPVSLTTTTSVTPDGSYTFANLRPGNYTVHEIQPVAPTYSLVDGTVTVGSVAYTTPPVSPAANNGALTTETPSTTSGAGEGVSGIVLGSGGTGTNYNFGEVPLLPISGKVFVDKNYDGISNGTDSPLPSNGVTTLTLCLQPNNPCTGADIVAVTTSTPGSGTYTFPVQPSGTYYVVEAQPVGYGSSSPNVQTVSLVATPVTNVDFAETGASLSGTVYADNNSNGVLDVADVGIQGVTMKLCLNSTLPTCASPVATATTIVGGSYTFADIPAPPAGDSYVIIENETTGPLTALNNGTATVGTLVGGTGLVNGTIVGAEQGAAFTGDSKINGISFVMPTAVVTGTPPVAGTAYNFGEIPLGGVSGRVFVDRDFTNGTTGTYNPATDTTLLNNGTTTITLCTVDPASNGGVCPPASVFGTTNTATDGTYNFPVVPAGNYWAVETQPVGYGSSSPNVVPIVRTGTTPVLNVNFADTVAEIRGTVYRDDNGSGTLTPGEPGIGAVTVKLCLSTDPTCSTPLQTTTTTAISGTYTFGNLLAPASGTSYFIKEEQSTVPAILLNGTTTVGALTVGSAAAAPVGAADTANSTINNITWTPDAAPVNGLSALGTNYNFGELPTTTISGAVILDRDATGTSTAGDTGLASTTTVTLCRSAPAHGTACPPADVVATTTTTPGSGTYTFPGITPGTYYVVETQPVGYGSSSSNTSAPIVATTTPITGVNFYETGAQLSGTVFKDVDYSGAYNAGDVPLQNVVVRLCTTNNCAAGSVVSTATTTVVGLYQFNDVPAPAAGQPYFIVEDQATVPPTPTTLGDGTSTVGTFALGGGATSGVPSVVQTPSRFENLTWTPATSLVTGVPSVVGTNFNFGEILGFDVTGKVFFDQNRNGAIDAPADTGIRDVVITLCRVAGVPCTGSNIVATTTTSLTGDYSFDKVPPGSYFMQEAQPAGYGSVPTTTAPTVTDVRPFTVAGAPVTGVNFADTLSSISGLVYRDDNGSQTRDGTEPTMPGGITITLTGIDATGAAVTRSVVTSATGSYVFDNLKTGTYTITESQPAGFGTGGSNPGTLAGGSGGPNSNTITNVILPANTDAPNYNFGDTPRTAGVAGTVWRDNDHDRQRDADEPVLPGWTVQVLRTPPGGGTPTVVASAITDANGAYSIVGLEAGGGYSVRFIAPGGAVFGGAVDGEQGVPVSGASVARGEITNLTLTASVTGGPTVIPQQSLPVDPSGVVYDSDTRLPVPGAQVSLQPVNCPIFDPAIHLVGGAGNQTQVVGADGMYQFLLNPGAPACEYRLAVTPPGQYIADPGIPPQPGPFNPPSRPPNDVFQVVPNSGAPQDGQPTTYYMSFNLNGNSRDIVNNHIPLVSKNRPVLFISKVANKAKVELGETVKYTVKVRYASGAVNLPLLKVVDTMPAGFKLIPGTSYVSVPTGAPLVLLADANIAGSPGPVVTYNIPLPATGFAPGAEIELTYRVRVGVGSMQGDGINRAQARSVGTIRSNIAQAKVIVDPGVFTNDGCVAGKVFVDCNNNHVQDAEELGVPGVRLYMEDGTYFVTDSEGKYSYCGISPKSHVISVDMLTMPRGSRMTTTSNRNLGDGNSIFLDMKNGQLIRSDFAEGSCSNTVLEQVKSRRTQGEVRSVETEKTGQPALKWEGKSPQYPQQGTDGANQPLVVPRSNNGGTSSTPEQNTPVPQMPGASSNTQGANLRNAK